MQSAFDEGKLNTFFHTGNIMCTLKIVIYYNSVIRDLKFITGDKTLLRCLFSKVFFSIVFLNIIIFSSCNGIVVVVVVVVIIAIGAVVAQ